MQAVLDKKTQNILKEKFGNKSLEEIKEIVKKEKDANYAKKISNAFWRITSTVAVTALCIRLAV
jgi:ribosomal protein L11